ncbi:MAG: cytochrome c [Acidobacteriia bacterium]|nr:cytochrome c [Terriglobia bacterium]
MKLTKILLAGCVAMSFGIAHAAEDAPADHKQWMKDLGSAMGQIRKGVDVEQNAAKMVAVMPEVKAFWAKRTSDVAVKTCDDSANGAKQAAAAAKAGDQPGVTAGMKLVGAGCKGCHDVHREKISDTEYKIK